MEEDIAAILKKLNTAAKPATAPKAPEARQEPRQHASGNKPDQPKSFVYVVEDKNPSPGSTVVVREKGWNGWENDERPQSSSAPSTSSPGSAEPNLWCSFHKSKAHDTRNCRHLVDALFSSYENGTANVELPKPMPNNTKSWSKNKEKKARKNQDKSGTRPKRTEDDKPEEQDEDEGEAQVEEEQPRNRRRVQVILLRPISSSDEEEDKQVHDLHEHSSKRPNESVGSEGSNDLRNKLRRKSQTTDRTHDSHGNLRSIIEKSKARKIEDSNARFHLRPRVIDLRDKLNSKSEDLRIKLNRPKRSDLRRRLEEVKSKSFNKHKYVIKDTSVVKDLPIVEDSPSDLRTQLRNKRVVESNFLNVIMGGSPPCGDSARSVKDHRRQAITTKKWPSNPENDLSITFSPDDAIGVHLPHNDPLLNEVGIAKCDIAKVLVDTGSSVDLIFRDTLDKMGVDLRDMKPSARSLTGFKGASETMIGTIKLQVYACGVTRTIKFSVIRTKALYNAILGTPWLHSMKAISSTYHQCVKFPGPNGQVQTLCGDQQAARDLLVATMKMQQSTPRINAIAKQIQPQKDEILEVTIDDSDQSKVVRVVASLSEEMQRAMIYFLKQNASTFPWATSDMRGINPAITSHELNVDPTIKPVLQKRRKLGPERSKAVNE